VTTQIDFVRAWQAQETDPNVVIIAPQKRQEEFHASLADIVIFGGAAGGG